MGKFSYMRKMSKKICRPKQMQVQFGNGLLYSQVYTCDNGNDYTYIAFQYNRELSNMKR